MMTNIYDHFNHIETDIPKSQALSQKECSRYFKQFQTAVQQKAQPSWFKKKSTMIAAAALLLVPTALSNETVQATAGKLLNDMTYSMSDIISPKAKQYATHINNTLSVNGIDYKLTDVYADGHYLTYHLLVDYPDDRDANQASVSPQSVKLNGHHVMDGSFGSSEIIDEARQIVSNTQTIHLRDALLDGQQELELTFSESNSKEQAVYQINVDSSELTKDTAVYKMNQNHTFDGRSIDIQQLMINPLTSRLTIEYEGDQETYDVVLKDSDGKSYSFDTNTVDEQADGSYKAMLTFNPDFSEGSIESLNEADTLTFYFTGQDSFKNGDVKNNFNTDDNEAFTYHLKR